MIPQIILICLFAMGLGVHIAKHGEDKDSKYNFFIKGLSIIIMSSLLYCGGFFDVFFK